MTVQTPLTEELNLLGISQWIHCVPSTQICSTASNSIAANSVIRLLLAVRPETGGKNGNTTTYQIRNTGMDHLIEVGGRSGDLYRNR